MGDIFSSCSKVIVWLGESENYLDDLLWFHQDIFAVKIKDFMGRDGDLGEFYSKYCSEEKFSRWLGIDITEKQWEGYARFFQQRRWFTLAWVVQQVVLAPNLEIL